jgi:ankyrin repeat protein
LGLKKNATANQWKALGSQIAKRKREEGKESEVYHNGILKPFKKVQRAIGRYHNRELQGQEPLIGVLLKTPPSSPRISSQQFCLNFIEHQPVFETPQYQDLVVTLQNEQTHGAYMNFEPQSTSFTFHDSELALPITNDYPARELYGAQMVFIPGKLAANAISGPVTKRDLLLTDIPWVQAVDELFSTPGLMSTIRSWIGKIPQALDQTNSGGSYYNMSSAKLLCNLPNHLLSGSTNSKRIIIEASMLDRTFLSLIYQISNNKLTTKELQHLLSLLKDDDSAEIVSVCLRRLFYSKNASAKQVAGEIFNQAVRSGDAEFVRKLIHLGADHASLHGNSGGQLLTQAILYGHLDMAHLLLDYDADPNCEDEEEHYGAIRILFTWNDWSLSEKRTILRRLVYNGADINNRIQEALEVAIFWKNDIELVEMLLENGANPDYVSSLEQEDIPNDDSTPPSDDIIHALIDHFGPKWDWLQLRGIILAARDSFYSVQNFLTKLDISETEEWRLLAEALNVCVDETSYWGQISPEIWYSESECSDYEQSPRSVNSNSPYSEIGVRNRTTDRSVIENLLKAGADPNYDGGDPYDDLNVPRGLLWLPRRRSTLLYAIRSHHRRDRTWKSNILIKHGADFSKPGLLETAVSLGYLDLFQQIFEALTDFKCVHVPTIFYLIFCKYGRRSRAKVLNLLRTAGLDAFGSINDHTRFGMTPLQHACENGKIEVVRELLSLEAEINGRLTADGKLSALHIAVKKRNLALVELLLERGARVNEWPEMPGQNLFQVWANSIKYASLDNFREIEQDAEHIFDLLATNRAETVFHATGIEQNWDSCFATLLYQRVPESFARRIADKGVSIDCANFRNQYSHTTVFESVMTGYSLDFIQWLIRHESFKPVPNSRCLCSIIMSMKTCEILPKIKFILQAYSFDLNRHISCFPIQNSWTALHTTLQHLCRDASSDIYSEVVPLLLAKGADINAPATESAGRTALQAACAREDEAVELVRFLVQSKAKVNAEPANHRGVTALQAAAIQGHLEIVLYLLEHGAEVDAPGAEYNGRTALEGAAEHGRLDVTKLLLNAHVDQQKSAKCAKPLEYAKRSMKPGIAQVLEEWVEMFGSTD